MEMTRKPQQQIPPDMIGSIAGFPLHREVRHCGQVFQVSSLDLYTSCPNCGARIKVRSFSGGVELEDVFGAVFAWMSQPGAEELVRSRQRVIEEDKD
jgi:predicted  nucleic acid-binding Zn-ribbon protein